VGINRGLSRVTLVVRSALLIALVACSSNKPKHIEDAGHGAGTASGSSGTGSSVGSSSGSSTDAAPPAAQTTGDVQIRVEWPTMPLSARVSPGASACGTPLVAQVAPTTTWGIPDVVVFVDGAPSSNASSAPAPAPPTGSRAGGTVPRRVDATDTRVVVDRCTVMPRIAIGSSLAIASAATQPLKVSFVKRFASIDPTRLQKAAMIPFALPIAGHEVVTVLDDDFIYRVAPDGKDVDDGWIVAATSFITDPTGVALIKDVPPGKHAVHVWLPPRGGQPARSAKGEVTVEVGDLADLTLTLQ